MPGWQHLIAYLDETPAGMATGAPDSEPGVVELLSFWVAPAGRGKGVSDRLIGAIESWALDRGGREFQLAVRPDNAAAIAAYQRLGFADTGRLGNRLPDGGHELIFGKPLRDD